MRIEAATLKTRVKRISGLDLISSLGELFTFGVNSRRTLYES